MQVIESTDQASVWKWEVPRPTATGRSFIDVPAGTILHSVGMQDETVVVWGLVPDPKAKLVMQRLLVANTGLPLPGFPNGARFLGTVVNERTGIVWHVWDGDA